MGADEETPLKNDPEDYDMFGAWVNTMEPFTSKWKAESPTPLKLLGKCGATILLQSLGVFEALGYDDGHGWLCQGSAWLLWNFPLACCMVMPFLQYWRYCDRRLFYECLRNKILLCYVEEPFFTSPTIITLAVWLLLGLTMIFFGKRQNVQEWNNTIVILVPFLLPVSQFFITLFMTWDIKYFLITLANFADTDADWAEKHLGDCVPAYEAELYKAFQAAVEDGDLPDLAGLYGPPTDSATWYANLCVDCPQSEYGCNSGFIFSRLRDKLGQGTPRARVVHERQVPVKDLRQRVKSLLFFQPSFWMRDLLWMPQDRRSKYFRMSFNIFAVSVWMIELFLVFLMTSTSMQHLVHQGIVHKESVPRILMWVEKWIVQK